VCVGGGGGGGGGGQSPSSSTTARPMKCKDTSRCYESYPPESRGVLSSSWASSLSKFPCADNLRLCLASFGAWWGVDGAETDAKAEERLLDAFWPRDWDFDRLGIPVPTKSSAVSMTRGQNTHFQFIWLLWYLLGSLCIEGEACGWATPVWQGEKKKVTGSPLSGTPSSLSSMRSL